MLFDLSAEVAGHLVLAIRAHRQWADRVACNLPRALHELEAILASRAMRGRAGTPMEMHGRFARVGV